MKEIKYIEEIEKLKQLYNKEQEERIKCEYRLKGYERELKLEQNAKEGYKNMLNESTALGLELQAKLDKIDKYIKKINSKEVIGNDYSIVGKYFEDILSITKGEYYEKD